MVTRGIGGDSPGGRETDFMPQISRQGLTRAVAMGWEETASDLVMGLVVREGLERGPVDSC